MLPPTKSLARTSVPRTGFSLIELLAVLAVIGVLAAILLPVFSRIKGNSLGMLATAQMRQISQAVFLYATDHDNNLPGPMYSGQSFRFKDGRPQFLFSSIGVYLDQKKPTWRWEVADPSFMTAQQRDFFEQMGDDATFYSIKSGGDVVPFGYTVSGDMPMKLNAIEDPGNVFMLREVDQQAAWVYSSWSSRTPPEPLHGNFRHISYFDGSVEALPRSETDQP